MTCIFILSSEEAVEIIPRLPLLLYIFFLCKFVNLKTKICFFPNCSLKMNTEYEVEIAKTDTLQGHTSLTWVKIINLNVGDYLLITS